MVRLRAPADLDGEGAQQYRFDSNVSVVETVLRELRAKERATPGEEGKYLKHGPTSLPYDFHEMLTPAGLVYAEALENLNRYYAMHAETFRPKPFEGSWAKPKTDEAAATTDFSVPVTAPSVTVVTARRRRRTGAALP